MKRNHLEKAASKALAILLILAMCFSSLGMTAAGEATDDEATETPLAGESGTITIAAFAELAEDADVRSVPLGTVIEELKLPEGLDAMDSAGDALTVTGVTWVSEPEYDGDRPGIYAFTAVLPEGYEPDADVEPPQIAVTVEPSIENPAADPKGEDEADAPLLMDMPDGADMMLAGFAEGSGTVDKPYIIKAAADLDAVRDDLGAHYKLDCDIDLTGYLSGGGAGYNKWDVSGWEPIGTSAASFTGSLDGEGYKITGLWINRTRSSEVALFGFTNGATIKNIGVEIAAAGVTGFVSTGGLVGFQDGGSITNCYAAGNVDGVKSTGGLVGYLENGKISNCYATGNITGTGDDINDDTGGLVGSQASGSIINCYATGKVIGKRSTGGLVGSHGGSIEGCYATGSVTGIGSSSFTGGLVGYQGDSGSITSCYTKGNVTGNGNYTGGVVGSNSSYLSDCYNTGTVTGSSVTGGVTGTNGFAITNCYNTGTVVGTKIYTGGVVGHGRSAITNCYNTGAVSGTLGYSGGVVGYNSSRSAITNCYNTGAVTSGRGHYSGGVAGYSLSAISNCHNTGTVTSTLDNTGGVVGASESTISNCYNAGAVSGYCSIGGVVGRNASDVSDCYNLGTVTGYDFIGGVVGNSRSRVENCYNLGIVAGTHYSTGGVVGETTSIIEKCYNTGSVTGEDRAGGVVGETTESATVSNCYNVGVVKGQEYVGGLVGLNAGILKYSYTAGGVSKTNGTWGWYDFIGTVVGYARYCTINNCYWNEDKVVDGYDKKRSVGNADYNNRFYAAYRNSTITNLNYNSTGDFVDGDTLTKKLKNLTDGNPDVWMKHYSDNSCCGGWVDYYPELKVFGGSLDLVTVEHSKCSAVGRTYEQTQPKDADEAYFTSGDGSIGTPYLIHTAEQMNHVRKHTSSCHSLCADISLVRYSDWAGWEPIPEYSGVFNGNGHRVTNLKINRVDTNYIGLFSNNTHMITGLTVAGEVGGNTLVGGIAGGNSGTIEYCNYTGTVWASGAYAGGITGRNFENGTIDSCSHTGNVVAETHLGGIAGQNDWAVSNCTNHNGNIYMDNTTGTSIGGIVGYNGGGHITGCVNYAEVNSRHNIGNNASTGGITGTNWAGVYNSRNYGVVQSYGTAGGIAGCNYNLVEGCLNEGMVAVYCPGGGIVGRNEGDSTSGTLRSCTNKGTVTGNEATGKDSYYIGGAVGYNNKGKVEDCHNTGTIKNFTTASSATGGLVGYGVGGQPSGLLSASHNEGAVSGANLTGGLIGWSSMAANDCFNTGTVTGSGDYIGGLTGNSSGTVLRCYNTGSVSGSSYVGGISGYIWNDDALLDACCNTGNVTGTAGADTGCIGGIVGDYTAGTVTNCWYDKQKAGAKGVNGTDTAGAAGLTTAQMVADDVLELGGPMSGLGKTNWSKRAATGSHRYYPELTAFHGGTGEQQAASEKSARVGKVMQAVGDIIPPLAIFPDQFLTLTSPDVQEGTEIITAQGWQLLADGESDWTEYTGGSLTSSYDGCFLRYYATSASGTVYSNTVTITVNTKPIPTIETKPTASPVWKGGRLSASKLTGGSADVPGSFEWMVPATIVNDSGAYGVTFTPTNTVDYNTVTTTVLVTAVDKDMLEVRITAAVGLKNAASIGEGNGQYTQEAVGTFASAIAAAQGVANSAPTTQADADAALAALEDAIGIFSGAANAVDASILWAMIGTAQGKLGTATEGEKNGDHHPGAMDALDGAISAAEAIAEKPGRTPAEVQGAQGDLQAAITAFDMAEVTVNYGELADLIALCLPLHEGAEEGERNGDYEAGSKDVFLAAIDAAKDVAGYERATQTEVNDAKGILLEAMEQFAAKKIGVNYDILNGLIAQAEQKLADGVYGDRNGEWLEEAKEDLETAASAAKTAASDQQATQAAIDAAAAELAAAITAFGNAQIVVNYQPLKNLIDTANNTLTISPQGEGRGQYPQPAFDTLGQAVKVAQAIADNDHVSQQTVNDAFSALTEAVADFYASAITVDTDALEQAIDNAKAVKCGAYTVASWNALQSAVSDGEELLVKQYVIQSELDAGEKAIRDAIAALKVVPAADALKELIEEAQKLIDSQDRKDIGDGDGQYPQNEIDKLQDAIDKARDILGGPGSSEADLLDAIEDLQKAINDFRDSRINVDLSALNEAIAKAGALKQDDYTKATWGALQKALTNAKALADKNGVTQTEIDAAEKALTDALNALVRVYRFISGFGDFTGSGDLTGTIDAPYSEFVRLIRDGVEVDPTNYTVAEGSTVITLKEVYLKTLKNGTYTVKVEFKGGYAETTLKVAVPADAAAAPTGDSSHAWLWIALMGAAILGIIGTARTRKKKLSVGKRRT